MTVYLMQSGKTKLYKIGYTNRVNVDFRLEELRLRKGTIGGNDKTIELVAHWRGSKKLEDFLHKRHREFRVQGEWFRLSADRLAILHQFMLLANQYSDTEGWNMLYLICVKEH